MQVTLDVHKLENDGLAGIAFGILFVLGSAFAIWMNHHIGFWSFSFMMLGLVCIHGGFRQCSIANKLRKEILASKGIV